MEKITLQKAVDYDIKLEYYSGINTATCILQWSAAAVCKEVIPASQLFAATASCIGNGTGLKAAYFSNAAVADAFPATATVTKTEPIINFNWAAGSPAGISNDLFKARFTGNIHSTDEGTYTFYITADDGVRLWVNNQLLVDSWIDQGATEYQASINLTACTAYPIRIEYYENGGDAVCKFEWSGPVTDREVVPASQLSMQEDTVTIKELFSVFPNPADDYITIVSKDNFKQGDAVVIYDMLGRKLSEAIVTAGSDKINIPVNVFASGIYVARIISGNVKHSVKFMKR